MLTEGAATCSAEAYGDEKPCGAVPVTLHSPWGVVRSRDVTSRDDSWLLAPPVSPAMTSHLGLGWKGVVRARGVFFEQGAQPVTRAARRAADQGVETSRLGTDTLAVGAERRERVLG